MIHPYDYELCYVDPDSNLAYFLPRGVETVTGDDWDDAPYEANAGAPYLLEDEEPILVPVVSDYYDIEFPKHFGSYSVDRINKRDREWIHISTYFKGQRDLDVYGGDTLSVLLNGFERLHIPVMLTKSVWDRIDPENPLV